MPIGPFRFRPRLWPTLVTLLMLPMLAGLGLWQLERAAYKRAVLADIEAAADTPPRTLTAPLPARETLLRRRVVVEGRYDGAHQYLLDNQVREGRAGYRVLTPLRLAGSGQALLVDRGWRPAGADRSRLPAVPAPEGRQRVEGVVTRGPRVGLRLGEAYVGDGSWPRRVQYLDFAALARPLPYDLAPMVVEPGATVADRAGEAPGGIGPERHTGYAVQWFALASALLVIFVVVNTERRSRDEP